jgi:anhydro-N-acetylmuramic acid kinase
MKIIGAMSGSSLDGLDLALCDFSHTEKQVDWEVLSAKTFSFPNGMARKLANTDNLSVKDVEELAISLSAFTADCVRQMPNWESCEAVAIHGHTIQHEPVVGYSLQITNPWHLFKELGKTVVADFRNADIALGGQGAPLVPKADLDLFTGFDAFLNLGGIANATYFEDSEIYAYDLFACNQWLNSLSSMLGKKYDEDGCLSEKGIAIPEVVEACLAWEFCNEQAPKSLSNSACFDFFTEYVLPFTQKYNVEDVMKSCIVAMARAIGKPLGHCTKVLVSGGGAYNNTLMTELKEFINAEIPTEEIVEFKEAIAFAYLGYCRVKGISGNVPKATGASREALLGCLYNF